MNPLIEIFAPRREGSVWVVEAVVRTPFGPLRIRGEGDEALAHIAMQHVRQMLKNRATVAGDALDEIGGFWGDLAKGVRQVARSKAMNDVMASARFVLKSPIFRKIAGNIPIVSNVVTASDMAFSLADGLRAGHSPSKVLLGQIQALANSSDPAKAAEGKKILTGLQAAEKASALVRAARNGVPQARQAVKQIEADALKGVAAARTAFLAIDAAQTFDRRSAAANLATAALNGDPKAAAKISKLESDAAHGDEDAIKACRTLRRVIVNRKTPMEPVAVSTHGPAEYVATTEEEARAATSDDATSGLDVGGLSPRHARMLDELRALRTGRPLGFTKFQPSAARRGAPLRRSA